MSSKKRKTTDDGSTSKDGGKMVVPRAQVEDFLKTLKAYSYSCAESKKAIMQAQKDVGDKVVACELERKRCVDERESVVTAMQRFKEKYDSDEAIQGKV